MKKIQLHDKFMLTDRFLEGQLSMVADMSIAPDGKNSVQEDGRYFRFDDGERVHCRFAAGDVVPVVMSYSKAGLSEQIFGQCPGWTDKRCVNPAYMPYKLEVVKVRCERVQDLTEEDVLRMGMVKNAGGLYMVGGKCGGTEKDWRKMFSRMFDMMFKVPYGLNPWVILYDMKPIR